MRHKRTGIMVAGLTIIGLSWGVASADPGNGHGPPPDRGPKGTPTASADGATDSGSPGKGACVSACQRHGRDCKKATIQDRKTCYATTCAEARAAVEACNGGGQGGVDQVLPDGVTDQGGDCDAAALDLRQCLRDCRTGSKTARQNCAQTVKVCKIDCGLPFPTPTPTPL